MIDTNKTPFALTAVLLTSGILAAGQFAKISVPFEALIQRFPGRGLELGLLLSLVSVTGGIAGLFFGAYLARVGFRKPLLVALALGAVLSFVQMLPLNLPVFLAIRVLEGLSHLIIVVAAPTLIGQICAPHQKAIGLTIWSTVFGISFALFTWIGLPIVEQFGLPALFGLHGMLLLLTCMAIWILLPAGIVPRSDLPLSLSGVIARHRETYSSPWICAPALGWFFYATGFVALVTTMPLIFDKGAPTYLRGILPVAALVVSLTLGVVLVRRVSAITVAIAGFTLAAVCAVFMMLGSDVAVLAICMFCALGLVQAGTFSAIPILVPRGEQQALANGALAQLGNTGNLIGTPLLLWLPASTGVAKVAGFSFVLFGLGALCHVWLAILRRRAQSAAQ
jgi:predicted MFS family arabinose efflux permease